MLHKREFYIPKGSIKVADKRSSAVAYLYDNGRGPCAVMFAAKRQKPDQRYRYRSDGERAESVAGYFQATQETERFKAELRAKRLEAGRGLKVGDILYTCWGYDQTNSEFFQVTDLIGKTMVELREIAQGREDTHWMQWRATPVPDKFIDEPIRRVAKDGRVTIDKVRHASIWNGRPVSCSGYA